jgi:type I site-specific restriction endonuclease
VIDPSEAITRRDKIDPALNKAGRNLANRAQVRFEIPIDGGDAEPWNAITDYFLYLPNGENVATVEAEGAKLEAEARDLTAKAQAIEDAVYDLKAVNPNAKTDEKTRTPAKLIALIRAKGREVEEALCLLDANGKVE